ncbi:MAG: hypothetical protein M0R77_00795 [Gammaproteobacteria bacterium]|nr:hypothetical protein [Acholeplasmataceae bacterium]MCK9529092.1 hypothetical protein [Gammaproteobacteria bacterium]
MSWVSPYTRQKILPLNTKSSLCFKPELYEKYIWLDLRDLFDLINNAIISFEDEERHRKPNGLINVPIEAGSVFGIDAKILSSEILDLILSNGTCYDLSVLHDWLSNYFYTEPDDPDKEYYDNIISQFFSLIIYTANIIVEKYVSILGAISFNTIYQSDYRWKLLQFYRDQALIGFGLKPGY